MQKSNNSVYELTNNQIKALATLGKKIVVGLAGRQLDGIYCRSFAAYDLMQLRAFPALHLKLLKQVRESKGNLMIFDEWPAEFLLTSQVSINSLAKRKEIVMDRDGEFGSLGALLARKYINAQGRNSCASNLVQYSCSRWDATLRSLMVMQYRMEHPNAKLVNEYLGDPTGDFLANLLMIGVRSISLMLSQFLQIEMERLVPRTELTVPSGYINVPSDGHCLYHALAVQTNIRSDELHRMAIIEVVEHPERYEGFVVNMDLDGLIAEEVSTRVWAGNIMIQALANALGRPVMANMFDINGNPNGEPLRIDPVEVNEADVGPLVVGNIDNLHFVALAHVEAPVAEHDVGEIVIAHMMMPVAEPAAVEVAGLVEASIRDFAL